MFRSDRDTDEDLTQAARCGSRQAFDALTRAHGPRLHRFIARQVGVQAADDVLQETWIAGWAALPRLTRRAGFKAWLYGVAANKCRDHHRRQAHEAAAAVALQDTARLTPPAWEEHIAVREEVHAVLVRLPYEQREVVELYYYADLTLPEIAQALERNLNTVKYQFYRAHAKVAQGLEGSLGHDTGDTMGMSQR